MRLRQWLARLLVGIMFGGLHPDLAFSASVPTAPAPENTPRLVIEAGGHRAIIRELLFTADGRELVSVSDDKTIRIWGVSPDGRRAALARTLRGQIGEGLEGLLAAASLSPPNADGQHQWLAVGGHLAGSHDDHYAVRLHVID